MNVSGPAQEESRPGRWRRFAISSAVHSVACVVFLLMAAGSTGATHTLLLMTAIVVGLLAVASAWYAFVTSGTRR